MPTSRLVLPVAMLLLAACTQGPAATTAAPVPSADSPRAAIEGLVGALADGDWDATMPYVDDAQIALLTSIEGVPASQTAEMLRTGVPSEVRANFWRGFAEGFETFSEEQPSELLIGEPIRFEVEGVSFGAVQVSLRHHAGLGSWIARGEDEGWKVDLFATFGPAFASPLREWLEALPDDENGRQIRAEMAAQEPSFATALTYEPLGHVSDGARSEVQLLMIEANR